VLIPLLASESALGAAGASHLVLLRGELLLPLGIGLSDFLGELVGHSFVDHSRVSANEMKKRQESCNFASFGRRGQFERFMPSAAKAAMDFA
jgi:hypothetical protein